MNNVIFLDIDGCINTYQSNKLPGKYIESVFLNSPIYVNELDKKCIENFNKIIFHTNANIVISSTWRIEFVENGCFNLLIDYLHSQGLKGKIVSYTPIMDNKIANSFLFQTKTRAEEIKQYIQDHQTENYVVIDDDTTCIDYSPNWIQTYFEDGLTEELANKAIEILKI